MTVENKVILNGSVEAQRELQPAQLQAAQRLIDMVSTLQQRLQLTTPGYESILHQIHQTLAVDEALTHMLTEEQVGVIVSGLTRHKQVLLVEETTKKAGKKALSKTTAEDL